MLLPLGDSPFIQLPECRTGQRFIHIDGLRQILPFGVGVLQGQLSRLKGKLSDIIFTGQNAGILESKGT